MTRLSATPFWVRASRTLLHRLPAGRYRMMNALVTCMRRFGAAPDLPWPHTLSASPGLELQDLA